VTTISQLGCLNVERTIAVGLQRDRIWIQTSDYRDIESFAATFLAAIDAIHDEVTLDYIDTVSMRMFNAVAPNAGERLDQYVISGLLGLTDWGKKLSWTTEAQSAEHHFQSQQGHRVVVKGTWRNSPIGLPPDMLPLDMPLIERHRAFAGEHLVLDLDAGFTHREVFNRVATENHLRAVKQDLVACFDGLVTPWALEQWK
jgi:uncharacterized protein (TIGR04255 family)